MDLVQYFQLHYVGLFKVLNEYKAYSYVVQVTTMRIDIPKWVSVDSLADFVRCTIVKGKASIMAVMAVKANSG